MSSIDEKLWNYVDGLCTPDEHQAISLLIEQDETYRAKYLELLSFEQEISGLELEEPPMAFTYNVMETIRAGHAQQPLKATINQFLIKGIGLFFVVIILIFVAFAVTSIRPTSGLPNTGLNDIKIPDMTKYLNGPVLKGFLFFDVIIGLFLLDTILRKRNFAKQ